jgi:hypothetical protein
MESILRLGRALLIGSFFAFGVQQLLALAFPTPLPGAPWGPAGAVAGTLTGTILIVASVATFASRRQRLALLALVVVTCLRFAIWYLPTLVSHPRDPNTWTVSLELLALAGGALALATVTGRDLDLPKWTGILARLMVGLPLIGFAIQHAMYSHFVATLVPAWLPAPLFWTWFFGSCMGAAGVAIITATELRLAATLLGAMFLLWVVTLHIPRVAAAASNGAEWSSLLVAVGMAGVSFTLAGSARRIEPGIDIP